MSIFRLLDTPCGVIGIVADGNAVTRIFFGHTPPEGAVEGDTPLLGHAARELVEYFDGRRRDFTFPMKVAGTPFMQQVWHTLCEIPYGERRSYAWVAARCNRPKACRAVGMANHRNPLPVVVPCHRVVGADGSLTGYAGGMEFKEYLLRLEERNA